MNAKRDENSIPTMIAVLNTDGTTIQRIKVDSTTHNLFTSDGTSGTNHGTINAKRDENSVHCLMGVSSADGITPTVVYCDSEGNLLVKSS